MRYAVVYVQPPAHGEADTQVFNWQVAQQGLDTRMPYPTVLRDADKGWSLGGGVWVIPLAEGMPVLFALGAWCRACRCTFRAFFLDEKPEWAVVENPAGPPG